MSRICLSCWVAHNEELGHIAHLSHQVDLVEIRADRWQSPDWIAVRKAIPKPVIATIRRQEEGGEWTGDVAVWKRHYLNAIAAGCEWIDLDYRSLPLFERAFLTEVFSQQGVLSAHLQPDDDPQQVVKAMLQMPAKVYKCVLPASSARAMREVAAVITLLQHSGKAFIVHADGEDAQSTRLWAAVLGNAWTYVACGASKTASGQPALTDLQWYQLKRKTEQTRLLGLFGYPLLQSRGWQLHNALLHHLHLEDRWMYLNFPDPDFAAVFTAWEPWLDGASVTIPHKQRAVEYCQEWSFAVQQTGVCNTIVRRDGQWMADNTDVVAIAELLRPWVPALRTGLVVGTGATARSAIVALQWLKVKRIFVMGRSLQKCRALADRFGVIPLPLGEDLPEPADCLIHATPVGMVPNDQMMLPLEKYLHPELVLLDVVHNPEETRLLRTARQFGVADVLTGVELFLRQAYHQFAKFTGVEPSFTTMRSLWDAIVQRPR